MMPDTRIDEATRQVRRVFGAAQVRPETDDGAQVRVLVDGWLDWAVYRTDRLIETLSRFPVGYGTTADGDREVCSATTEDGAFIALD